jgi:subtilisin family serine protease
MNVKRGLALFLTLFAIVFLSLIYASPHYSFPLSVSPRLNYVPGELLVKYKPQIETSAVKLSPSQSGIEIKNSFANIGVHHVKFPSHMSIDEAMQIFKNNPLVEYAEPNYVRYIKSTIPNDTFFSYLWGLKNTGQSVNGTSGTSGDDIHATEAWDITKGNSTIVIAVIDSGVDYNHPDLASNISSSLRYDFVNNDSYPMDANEHGTHVTGTIAASGNNGMGVTGISWTATIMPLRAVDAFGTISVSNNISAIDYAIGKGARIINASYGGYDYSQAEYEAISNAKNAGILFVAAAGNESNNNDTMPIYPASYNLDNIIAVAATDQNDNLADFSNYGSSSVHVAAPGVSIYSTKPARQTVWSTNFDGGSMDGWGTGGTNNTWGLTTSQCYSGVYSLSVNSGGNYKDNGNSWAMAPVRDLSSCLGTKLNFVFTGQSEFHNDLLYVETSTNGSTWTGQSIYVTTIDGSYVFTYDFGISRDLSDQWYSATVDLGDYDGKSTVYIRFRFTSNSSINYMGWFIDDISVTAASSSYTGTEYQFMSGTSMATPHVTGIAALIWGVDPNLKYSQVKSRILNSVDKKSSLTGKIISGGRINALNALYYVFPQAPSSVAASATSSDMIYLTWTDNSTNESGFHIERKTDASGTYAQVATVDANVTSYSDTGLSASKTYYYRVASYNNDGNSDYSNEASATTSASNISGGGGGCFIATAAFGSPMELHVLILRDFRDNYLICHSIGRIFVESYYRMSPLIAHVIEKSEGLRTITRWCLMPIVGVAYLIVNFGMLISVVIIAVIFFLFISCVQFLLMIHISRR